MTAENRIPHCRKGRCEAFTLLEILAAVVILGLLVIALASISRQVGDAWQRVEAASQRREAARTVFHFLVRELRMAAAPVPDPQTGEANLQLLLNLPATTDRPGGVPPALLNPHALFFQAPLQRDARLGELALVGYFIHWDTTTPGQARPVLARYYVPPSDTTHYTLYSDTPPWPSFAPALAPATPPDYQGWLSDHVLALWMRALDSQGEPITVNAAGEPMGYGFDSREGYRDASGQVFRAPALPPMVEIALVTIDTRTASRLTAPLIPEPTAPGVLHADATTPGSIAHYLENLPPEIRNGTRLFTTRVRLTGSIARP